MSYFISGIVFLFVSSVGAAMGEHLFHIEPSLGAIFSMVFFISTIKLGEMLDRVW